MATRPARPLPVPPVVPEDSRRMIGVLSLVMRTLNFPFPPEPGKKIKKNRTLSFSLSFFFLFSSKYSSLSFPLICSSQFSFLLSSVLLRFLSFITFPILLSTSIPRVSSSPHFTLLFLSSIFLSQLALSFTFSSFSLSHGFFSLTSLSQTFLLNYLSPSLVFVRLFSAICPCSSLCISLKSFSIFVYK